MEAVRLEELMFEMAEEREGCSGGHLFIYSSQQLLSASLSVSTLQATWDIKKMSLLEMLQRG